MKKLIYVLLAVLFFLIGLSFFYQNSQPVAIQYYLGLDIQLPLTALLLITLVIGVMVGYLASLAKSLKLRRRLSRANKTIKILESSRA